MTLNVKLTTNTHRERERETHTHTHTHILSAVSKVGIETISLVHTEFISGGHMECEAQEENGEGPGLGANTIKLSVHLRANIVF